MSDPLPTAASGCPQCAKLAELVGQLQAEVRELHARLNTHSGNSSLPPSANPPSAPKPPPKLPTGRKPGGQPGHPGHHRSRLPPGRVNHVVPYVPDHCEHCQTPLPKTPGPHDPEPTWHQVAELPEILAVVTEHQGHARTCPCCGHVTWGTIPPEILAHAFGPNLTATLSFLSGCCHDSKRTVEEIAETVFGVPLSLGSVANAEQEVAAALQEPYKQAEEAVQQAPVKNADETGWALAGKLCWLWLAVTHSVAFFKICTGRGRAALRQLLGDDIHGVVSSDRWGAYRIIDLAWRQLCWAHLKRDFQKWVDWGSEAAGIGQAGLLAFLAEDADRRVFCYANGELRKDRQNDEILRFVEFWKQRTGHLPKELVFDSKLTTYGNLNELNRMGIDFMTLRRRSSKILGEIYRVPASAWRRIELENIARA